MSIAPNERSAPSHPWHERLRLRNVIILGVLGLCCALAISEFVERRVVVPACQRYAATNGLNYKAVDVHGPRQDLPGPRCVFIGADGNESEVPLQRMEAFLTDLWVTFLMDIEFTVPLCSVFIGLLWVWLVPLFSVRQDTRASNAVD